MGSNMTERFGAVEPRAATARKLNALLERVVALEEALLNKAEEKPAKKSTKKAEVEEVSE